MRCILFLLACAPAASLAQPIPAHRPLLGGGLVNAPHDDGLTESQLAALRAQIDAFKALHGLNGYGDRTPPVYPFYPQGGTFFGDLDCSNFVDLDPSGNVQDYACSLLARDGHAGIDSAVRSWAEMDIGVPVFAALPGVVVARDDGYPDRNTQGCACAGNYIIISHAGGNESWYFHLRNGSVSVGLGEIVRAGQQIGLTASSGNSFGPHLHFGTVVSGQVYEPFAGDCRPGPSAWLNQPQRPPTTVIRDAGVTWIDLWTVPGWPEPLPRSGQLALTDDSHYIWTDIQWLPANSNYRHRWVQPNGTIDWETPVYNFDNPDFYGRAIYWFPRWIYNMHYITGTWRIQMDINGVQVLDLPIEVRTERTPDFNRPPAAIGLTFEPDNPTPDDVLFCRVQGSYVYDDPDCDIVRYHYVWTLNGQPIRDIISAGRADAIPTQTLTPGSTITCGVTPSDGTVNGAIASISYTLPGAATPT